MGTRSRSQSPEPGNSQPSTSTDFIGTPSDLRTPWRLVRTLGPSSPPSRSIPLSQYSYYALCSALWQSSLWHWCNAFILGLVPAAASNLVSFLVFFFSFCSFLWILFELGRKADYVTSVEIALVENKCWISDFWRSEGAELRRRRWRKKRICGSVEWDWCRICIRFLNLTLTCTLWLSCSLARSVFVLFLVSDVSNSKFDGFSVLILSFRGCDH